MHELNYTTLFIFIFIQNIYFSKLLVTKSIRKIKNHGFHLITYRVASIYFLSTHVIFYILLTIFNDCVLPIGFSARLAINWTAFRTVSDKESSSLWTIDSKGQKLRISIFPWFNCAKEQSKRQTYLLTRESLLVTYWQSLLI